MIDHKLVEKAADGDLKAIKLIHDIVIRDERLGLLNQPTAEELLRHAEEEQEKERLSKQLADAYVEHLETIAELKKLGALYSLDGHLVVPPWVTEAGEEWRRKKMAEDYRRITGRKLPPDAV